MKATKGRRPVGAPKAKAKACGPEQRGMSRTILSHDGRTMTIRVPLTLRRRGGRKLIVSPDGVIGLPRRSRIDDTLVKALARAHRWQKLLENGTYASVVEIAESERINASYVGRVLRMTLLAPEIVETILDARQPPTLRLEELLKAVPLEWSNQRRKLGDLH